MYICTYIHEQSHIHIHVHVCTYSVLYFCSHPTIPPYSHSPIPHNSHSPIPPVHFLETQVALQTFEEDNYFSIYNPSKPLSNGDMTILLLGLFEEAERCPAIRTEPLYVNRAVELSSAWIRDVYDM